MFLTERLLRGSKPTDKDMILGIFNNLASAPGTTSGFIVPKSESFVEKFLHRWSVFFVVEERNVPNVAIGVVGIALLDPRSSRATLRIALLEQYWSRGYGTEMMCFILDYSFKILGLRRIELQVYEGNDRAYVLYKNLGFVTEGKLRKARRWNDGWRDIRAMAITNEEWKEHQQLGVPANS